MGCAASDPNVYDSRTRGTSRAQYSNQDRPNRAGHEHARAQYNNHLDAEEAYVSHFAKLDGVLEDYQRQRLSRHEAIYRADSCMDDINDLPRIDIERARALLERRGFEAQVRQDMERAYHDLKQDPSTNGAGFRSEKSNSNIDLWDKQSEFSFRPEKERNLFGSGDAFTILYNSRQGMDLAEKDACAALFRGSKDREMGAGVDVRDIDLFLDDTHGYRHEQRPIDLRLANPNRVSDSDWTLCSERRGVKACEWRVSVESRDMPEDIARQLAREAGVLYPGSRGRYEAVEDDRRSRGGSGSERYSRRGGVADSDGWALRGERKGLDAEEFRVRAERRDLTGGQILEYARY